MNDWRGWIVAMVAIALAFGSGYGISTAERMERQSFVRDSIMVDRVMDDLKETRMNTDTIAHLLSRYVCYPPVAE